MKKTKVIILILAIFNVYGVATNPMHIEKINGDGSCLFSSLQYVLKTGVLETGVNELMRERVAKEITNNPSLYNKTVLGKSVETYEKEILSPSTWGGGIELAVFSNYYEMEIFVCNLENGEIIKVGDQNYYLIRVFLVYNGLTHYDAMYKEISEEPRSIETVFRTDDSKTLAEAMELCYNLANSD